MAKRIVFCADGTWNGPEKQTGVAPIDAADEHGELHGAKVTNVVRKLFREPGRTRRIAGDDDAARRAGRKIVADAAGRR